MEWVQAWGAAAGGRSSPSFGTLPTLDLGTVTFPGRFTIPSICHKASAQWLLK